MVLDLQSGRLCSRGIFFLTSLYRRRQLLRALLRVEWKTGWVKCVCLCGPVYLLEARITRRLGHCLQEPARPGPPCAPFSCFVVDAYLRFPSKDLGSFSSVTFKGLHALMAVCPSGDVFLYRRPRSRSKPGTANCGLPLVSVDEELMGYSHAVCLHL